MSPVRFVVRAELRGKKELFALAAAAMGFAAAVLALVLSLADSFDVSFNQSARELLGGDMSVRLTQRDFSQRETQWLRENSAGFTLVRAARVLASAKDNVAIARLKSVDDAYPLYGALAVRDESIDAKGILSQPPSGGAYPAIVGAAVLEQLDINIGDVFSAAGMTLRAAAIVAKEPDPDPTLLLNALLIMVHDKHLRAADIISPGMLVSRYARVKLPPQGNGGQWRALLAAAFPDGGWRVRDKSDAVPRLKRIINNMRDFLALASLAAMLIAGVGIGGAMNAFLAARIRAIAVVKMLGGGAMLVRKIYLCLAAVIAGSGALAGIVIGQSALLYLAPQLSDYLPLTLTALWSWNALGRTLLSAFLISAVFVLPPIMHYARANPLALFGGGARSDDLPPLLLGEKLFIAACALAAAALLPLQGEDKIVVAGIGLTALLLLVLARLITAAAAKMASATSPPLSWGLLAVSRNRRQSMTSAVSLGIGISALAAVMNVEGNFNAVVNGALRQEIPAMYMIGVLPQQVNQLREIIREEDENATVNAVPIVRGRITHLAGKPVAEYTPPQEQRWILRGDRGMTWSPDGDFARQSGDITGGTIWQDGLGDKIQMSFDDEAAQAFGLTLGDEVQVNILGRPLTAVITSFRRITWQRLNINFVMILSKKPFANVPHGYFAAAYMDENAARRAQRKIGATFANITPVISGDVFDTAQKILGNVAILLRAVTFLLLLGAMPVVVAALAASHRRRLRDCAAMRLVGAPTSKIAGAAMVEMICTAVVCVFPAVFFGLAAGRFVVGELFQLPWQPHLANAAMLVLLSSLFFVALGAISTIRTTRIPPITLLRND
ncbi:MAG: ABC transporter permease [Gammaproteobacteria bacterium]